MNVGIKDLYVCYFDQRLDWALEVIEKYWLDIKHFVNKFEEK